MPLFVKIFRVAIHALFFRKVWFPSSMNQVSFVDENFDYERRLISWQWGDLTENYNYDKFGHLMEIQTPLGFKHKFEVIPLIGVHLVQYTPSWSTAGPLKLFASGNGSVNKEPNSILKNGGDCGQLHFPGEFEIQVCNNTHLELTVEGTKISRYFETVQKPDKIEFKYRENKVSYFKTIGKLNGIPTNLDGFQIESDGFSTLVTNDQIIYLSGKDSNARLKLKTLLINGKTVHHQTFDYNFSNKLIKNSVKTHENTMHQVYTYQNLSHGVLYKEDSNDMSIYYNYDLNGNIISI